MELLLLALAPSIAICLFICYKDKYNPEPTKLLVYTFLIGMFSTIPAYLAIYAIIYVTGIEHAQITSTVVDELIYAFFVVALSEEGAKYFFLRYYAYPKKDFDEPFDGITYAVIISMGFATIENIMYVFYDGGNMNVGIHRMFTAIPAHAIFAVLMGYYVGLAKFSHRKYLQWIGLGSAIVLHGIYDACLFLQQYPLLVLVALLALFIGVLYSFKAIKIHQENSPFKHFNAHLQATEESDKETKV